MIKEKTYDSSGNLVCESEYDSQANLIRKIYYRYDGSSIYGEIKYEYEYDSQGNKIRKITYNDNIDAEWLKSNGPWREDSFSKIFDISEDYGDEYEYDSQGNMIKAIEHNNDGTVSGWIECIYE
jgi:hypothetical protein